MVPAANASIGAWNNNAGGWLCFRAVLSHSLPSFTFALNWSHVANDASFRALWCHGKPVCLAVGLHTL